MQNGILEIRKTVVQRGINHGLIDWRDGANSRQILESLYCFRGTQVTPDKVENCCHRRGTDRSHKITPLRTVKHKGRVREEGIPPGEDIHDDIGINQGIHECLRSKWSM